MTSTRHLPTLLVLLVGASCSPPQASHPEEAAYEELVTSYVEAWKSFYPQRATRLGLEEYQDREGDRSAAAVETWIRLNDSVRARTAQAASDLPVDLRIDLRLLARNARSELGEWDDPGEEPPFPLGRDRFARELEIYYDRELTPEELADLAFEEIQTTRNLMMDVAEEHWRETYPERETPGDRSEVLARALADMEENRASGQEEFLEVYTRFAREAEAFVEEAGIATLPPTRTLEIVLTPASAGPAQRIGFVDPAPPFDPDSTTLLSLPTIPSSFPPREKEDFYRSFNNHFNKAIIVHELFPGHYMQAKVAALNAPPARILFPYDPYIEGWATLAEKLALDRGWDDFNRLTYLAHLRKRLENANRAYTSVQVHCFGWGEEEVDRFSREESLLAPQFAASLFGRLQRGPMQMTSYFMGKEMFMEVLEGQRARLGEDFDLRAFSDTILRAGAVPMDMMPELLAEDGV